MIHLAKTERRASQRVPLQVEVGLHTESTFFSGYSEDLSDGGLFVATYRHIPVGTEVTVSVELPEGEPLTAHGRVVWVRQAQEHMAPGVGVAFDGLEPRQKKTILRFVRVRPALFYDL
jgi:uncharacterized protein (TIGR02266 family)